MSSFPLAALVAIAPEVYNTVMKITYITTTCDSGKPCKEVLQTETRIPQPQHVPEPQEISKEVAGILKDDESCFVSFLEPLPEIAL